MIKNKYLLILAGIFWILAGINIDKIGFQAYKSHITLFNILISIIIFIIFYCIIFNKLVLKHTNRIISSKIEKQKFYKFFDLKSYFIMIFMIVLGIVIRIFNLLSDTYIGVFYSGLGTALFLSGIKFIINYRKVYRG